MTTVLASDAGDSEHLDEEMEQIVTDSLVTQASSGFFYCKR